MRAMLAAVALFLSTLVLAEGGTDSDVPESSLTPLEVMDRMIEKGFGHVVSALEKSGGFYPFGLIRNDLGRVHFLSYAGDISERPSADAYAYELVWQMRNLTASNIQIRSALVVRPAVLSTADGGRVPAVHFIVDHRDIPAKSVLFPILRQNDEYLMGDALVIETDDFLMMNSPDAELERQTGEPQ